MSTEQRQAAIGRRRVPVRPYFEREGDQHWLSFGFGFGFEGVMLIVGRWSFGVEFGRV